MIIIFILFFQSFLDNRRTQNLAALNMYRLKKDIKIKNLYCILLTDGKNILTS